MTSVGSAAVDLDESDQLLLTTQVGVLEHPLQVG